MLNKKTLSQKKKERKKDRRKISRWWVTSGNEIPGKC
jgi:hypothetical protein